MCNDDWSLNEDSDDEVPELVHLFHADRVVNDHLNAFYGSNQSNRRMPDFAIRAQTFQFRRYPVATLSLIFEEWMTNLHSPVGVDSCHHCALQLNVRENVDFFVTIDDSGLMHALKLAPCGHSVCSRCIQTKRFIFQVLGLPICCNVCKTCWLSV